MNTILAASKIEEKENTDLKWISLIQTWSKYARAVVKNNKLVQFYDLQYPYELRLWRL
jgi:hypothetical protein